jgi:hypothetical protein
MKIFTIFLFASICSLSLFANENDNSNTIKQKKIKCAVENYEVCLSHENPGVVESSLSNIIKFSYRCPEAEINCFFEHLNELSKNAQNNKISKKAELVARILKDPELVKEIGDNFYNEVDQFLEVILVSNRFEGTLLTKL